ncbi:MULTISPECIES: fimbrial protein [Cupriavidus]|uniref:fimbrial protein n=1 Tax=Cupriavidus sp. DF5525 TaxID=3160989 RepID=UPI0032DF8E06
MQLKPTTCTVTNPVINVVMPAIKSNALGGINGTSAVQPFAINLDCPLAGPKVYVTLTDATTPGNTGSTLSLANGSTATGVGLQVLSGSTVVSYGPDSAVAGNLNQWQAGTSAGTAMSIPLGVRYIQTASSMGAGLVKGAATFTISYR